VRTVFWILGLILLPLGPSQAGAAEPAAAYYPLQPGMTWEYGVVSSKAGAGKIAVKNLPPREIDGKMVTPREWSMGGTVRYYLVARDDFGVYRYGELASENAEPTVITPKVYYLREPVDKGTTWDIVTKMGDRELKVNLTVESAAEEVKVPAGTFKDCVKIRHEGTGRSAKDGETTAITAYEWYAPGAGLVKSLATIKEKSKTGEASETLTYQLDSLKP
jgi:hypothetical protein